MAISNPVRRRLCCLLRRASTTWCCVFTDMTHIPARPGTRGRAVQDRCGTSQERWARRLGSGGVESKRRRKLGGWGGDAGAEGCAGRKCVRDADHGVEVAGGSSDPAQGTSKRRGEGAG